MLSGRIITLIEVLVTVIFKDQTLIFTALISIYLNSDCFSYLVSVVIEWTRVTTMEQEDQNLKPDHVID